MDAEAYIGYENEAMCPQIQLCSCGMSACIGRTLVLMQIKLAMAALAQHVATLRLAGDDDGWQTTADMLVTEHFVLVPKGKRCQLFSKSFLFLHVEYIIYKGGIFLAQVHGRTLAMGDEVT